MHFSLHPFIFSLLPLFFFLVFLLKWLSITNRPPHKNPPPSPRKLPVIGNLHQIGSFPHLSLHSLSQAHSPLMLLHFATTPVLIASSSAAAHDIMKTHDLIFSNRPKSTICEKITYGGKDVAFSPYGEYWRQMKSICVLQLLNNKRVQSFRDVREEETALMIEKILGSGSDVVNLSELIVELTGDVVCRVALGRKYDGVRSGEGGGGRRGFKEVLGEFVQFLGFFDIGDFAPWLKWVNRVNGVYERAERLAKELDEFLEAVVEEHEGRERKGEREQDFVDVLLEVQRENMAGMPIHRDSVKALILDRVATKSFLLYRNMIPEGQSVMCPFCSLHVETPEHLFLHCQFSWDVWSLILDWWHVSWVCPASLVDLFTWWLDCGFKNLEKFLWETTFHATIWSVWLVRNDIVFNNASWRVEDLGELIKTRVAMWIKVKFDIKVHSVEDFKGYLDGMRKVKV